MKLLRNVEFRSLAIGSLLLLAACSTATRHTEKPVFDIDQPHLQITLSFNPDLYQKPAFFLPKAYPSFAIWLEDKASGDLQTIYITGKAGRNEWIAAKERPESVPVWSGLLRPRSASAKLDVDAVTGATPSGKSTVIYWPVSAAWKNRQVHMFIEANISFDYNEYYTSEEGTPGYSGVNGQPSVIWRAEIMLADQEQLDLKTNIIGHGHVSGADHLIDPDMSRITTAADIFRYIGISYHTGSQKSGDQS